ncbi:hypothetical protein M153_2200002798 [Pseudoloma neurophilia]|uniref:Uncharacterized protein n=1 Tax=Pseudoloma neurophilia TaxID=146866 RepID=A0A0R0M315_9MICR|nr:hypothetical protein M153_2200002798 [Pseudoloma neurophilia]
MIITVPCIEKSQKELHKLFLSFSSKLPNHINRILISKNCAQEGSAFTEHVLKLKGEMAEFM